MDGTTVNNKSDGGLRGGGIGDSKQNSNIYKYFLLERRRLDSRCCIIIERTV